MPTTMVRTRSRRCRSGSSRILARAAITPIATGPSTVTLCSATLMTSHSTIRVIIAVSGSVTVIEPRNATGSPGRVRAVLA